MDEKEKKLEEVSERINNYKPSKQIPIFENYITFFSIAMSIMLFLFPNMFVDGVINSVLLYQWLLLIMPQYMWAFAFFIAGVLKAIGLLIDKKIIRIIGLILSALIYIAFSIAYSTSFPSIGFVSFVFIAIFTVISIPNVKHTGIRK